VLVATCVGLFLIGLFALTRSADQELGHWTSPAGEHLIVYEGDRDFSFFPLSVPRRHYLYVGRDSDPSGYGHRVSFDLHAGMVDPAAPMAVYVKRITVTWSDAGVSVEEPSGHRLFVPRRAYAGGR
jgi:hypothetical protein